MTLFGPLGPSLAGYIRSSKSLTNWLKPVSFWYANLAGYRKIGLKYDDLRTSAFHFPLVQFVDSFFSLGFAVVEERDDVQKVRSRLKIWHTNELLTFSSER